MLGILTDSLRIPGEVAVVLRYYVYALRDPRNGRVFYIGKGIGDRINAHTRDAGKDPESERAKLRTILDIEATGHPVELLFLRTDIEDETTAFIVEQAVIDAFHADGQPLTNLVRGHGSGARELAALPPSSPATAPTDARASTSRSSWSRSRKGLFTMQGVGGV